MNVNGDSCTFPVRVLGEGYGAGLPIDNILTMTCFWGLQKCVYLKTLQHANTWCTLLPVVSCQGNNGKSQRLSHCLKLQASQSYLQALHVDVHACPLRVFIRLGDHFMNKSLFGQACNVYGQASEAPRYFPTLAALTPGRWISNNVTRVLMSNSNHEKNKVLQNSPFMNLHFVRRESGRNWSAEHMR
jgi:hypothetical protein